jgi:hypothetical protein
MRPSSSGLHLGGKIRENSLCDRSDGQREVGQFHSNVPIGFLIVGKWMISHNKIKYLGRIGFLNAKFQRLVEHLLATILVSTRCRLSKMGVELLPGFVCLLVSNIFSF